MSSAVVRRLAILAAAERKISTEIDSKNSNTFQFILRGSLREIFAASIAEQGLDEPLLLFAVFQEVLRRYTGQKSVTVCLRQHDLPPRIIRLQSDYSVRDLLHRLKDRAADVCDADAREVVLDGEFFFRRNCFAPEREEAAAGLVRIRCLMQSSAGATTGRIEFDPKICDAATRAHFVASFETLLYAALTELDSPISKLKIVTTEDTKEFDQWNSTGRYYPPVRVDELFELRATERPEATAITFLNASLSYAELNDATNRLARRLQNLGVQPGVIVGICLDRCADMVVALLATFRTGAAYLPLDPAFPRDRLAFMQEDAEPLVVLTDSHLREKCAICAPHVLCLDLEAGPSELEHVAPPSSGRSPSLDDVAYVLYTSGSTGKPKGVQITHRALTNLLTSVSDMVGLKNSDVMLATTTISFDISTFEIFAPLIAGAHLIVAPREVVVNGELLAQAISASRATMLQATPAGWQVLLEAGWKGHADLKMLTAGEPLTRVLAQRLLERGQTLWNLYGPTEATVYATGRQILKDDAKITVGSPLPNYKAYVLDEHGQRLPIGAIGELFLGGIGVGAGYLKRPELTAAKFVRDPFSQEPAARMYRTGDLARLLPNGELDLLGRADNQIKLRGYRIELEEVEALLDTHPGISKSVARVVNFSEGNACLVAYVVPRDKKVIDEADWRQHALRILPSYMVPTAFKRMDSFLLTPNGKVDRKALPAFGELRLVEPQAESEFANSNLDQFVLNCWRRALGRADLNMDQDFFAAGGHSLTVMRMFAEVNQKLGCKLPVSLLVEAPTPRQFSELVGKFKDSPARHLVLMQPKGSLPPLYLVHHLLGDILIYRDLAAHFAPRRPVYGVQAIGDVVQGSKPYELKDLASEYVKEIVKSQPAGPVHLAGFSSGSILAFEMARQLKNNGFEVGLLALIDGEVHAERPRMSASVRYAKIAIRKVCKIVFKLRDEVAVGPRKFVLKRVRHIWLQQHIRRLERSNSHGELTLEEALLLAERSYHGEPYSGSALLCRFHDEAWRFGPDPLMGWSGLVKGGLKVVEFNGGHITGMGPESAPVMVAVLNRHMEMLEKVEEAATLKS